MSARPLRTLTGSCHCQCVRFSIETDFRELTTGIPVRATRGAEMA